MTGQCPNADAVRHLKVTLCIQFGSGRLWATRLP